ncbi:centriole and centriolar satellite protein OFD1-like isoform X2 [Porites lutea]|uniref:centriole and centriolar satellite protein OFD1-like isoform X2 n=1 Tax=Porites lutea TaxID=51062 RepID=UPI003CC5759B
MTELSHEEFKKSLLQTFQSRGVLETLKSQLRNRLIAELQETSAHALHGGLTGQDKSTVTENLCELAANSLVADHLKRCKYEYSLSVFLPESGLQESKVLTVKDILLILKITAGSQLYQHMEMMLDKNTPSKGLLTELLSHLAWSHSCEKNSKAVQTILQGQSSMDQLQNVEKQYTKNLQRENQKWSSHMENRLLELHRQWEQKKKKMLDEELEYLKATEIARVRLEEKEKHQREVQNVRKQLEQEFSAKAEKLKANEREKLHLLSNQKQLQEEEAYIQRQKLLEDMLSLKERESEFDLRQQMKTKSLQLEEERIKVLSEELKIKKSLLEDAETNYHRRLDEEVKRYQLKYEEESRERKRSLELKEKQLQQERENFENERSNCSTASHELQRTKETLKVLQVELQNNKSQFTSALKEREATIKRLNEDYKDVKEREVALCEQNASLQRKLLSYEEELKGNQRTIKELTDKSSKSSTDLLHLRDKFKQMEKNSKSKEVSWKELQKRIEFQLNDECQRKKKYQELYEGLLTRESLLKQEVTDLKLTLHQTQQVLDMELDRRRTTLINSFPHMETLPSVDDSPVDTQLHQHESHRTPSESKMNETSSTLVMIAQSKALFDRLEMEAKELEESYQKFQSRINQMELDVYPTGSAHSQPAQNLTSIE